MQWIDPQDCNKGFEYLYLLKADYEKLPAGSVEALDTANSSTLDIDLADVYHI